METNQFIVLSETSSADIHTIFSDQTLSYSANSAFLTLIVKLPLESFPYVLGWVLNKWFGILLMKGILILNIY